MDLERIMKKVLVVVGVLFVVGVIFLFVFLLKAQGSRNHIRMNHFSRLGKVQVYSVLTITL